MAHSNGASLVFLGGLAGGAAGHKEAAADKAMLANFRAMLNHLVFTGLDKRMWVLGAVLVMRVRLTDSRLYWRAGVGPPSRLPAALNGPLYVRTAQQTAPPAGHACMAPLTCADAGPPVCTESRALRRDCRPDHLPPLLMLLWADNCMTSAAGHCMDPDDLLQPRALYQACTATNPDTHAIPPGSCVWSARQTTCSR